MGLLIIPKIKAKKQQQNVGEQPPASFDVQTFIKEKVLAKIPKYSDLQKKKE